MNRFPHLPPLPLLLYSYLATEILAPFFASFLIMNSVFFLVKLIPFLNVVLELNIGFTDFLRLFSYLFPNMFLYSMPMAAMMGMIIAFSRLSSDTEILAFKANGISIYTILPPVIMVSMAIAGITGYFSIKLIPTGEIAMKQLLFQLAKEKIDKGIKENAFTEALGDVVVYVQSIDKTTGQWQNVWVSDMRDQTVPSITMAKSGSMVGDSRKMQVTIILENGSLNRPDGTYTQTVTFDRYQINIPLRIPSIIDGTDVTQQSISSMTMEQLQLAVTHYGRESKQGREALVHFHKRLVLPVGCFILSLLGLPLGLQARAGRSAIGIPLGLGGFILYYVLFTIGKNIAEESSHSVWVAMWFPNLIFFVFTVLLLRQTANEQPLIPKMLSNAWAALITRLIPPLMEKLRAWIHLPVKKLIKKSTLNLRQYNKTREELLGPGHLTSGTVHGNIKSMACHVPGCESYSCRHCTIEFKNVEIALQAGFTPCNTCKGILEKCSTLSANDKTLP
ncbi:MAG: LptF/LptG family permease [Proteobacteria bacterium]|jgi:lipopolysaccharide export system permease protein|nr:YjgP/YjgQ family permease [Desulfocapsa sp.]MBU3946403.1 LptF/LptG family permease [Pseudomonadota bacterium]MCG2743755.1 LptF/LptG family permease [Desulfobacteraceae bacterium]MBU4027292.1 LptF/LptG family permease [Pseudomonadota bacterium]MBU4041426.1 LptF/LptG family permease [Pseudomonadota bacterium]